jgi:hypothetical protein
MKPERYVDYRTLRTVETDFTRRFKSQYRGSGEFLLLLHKSQIKVKGCFLNRLYLRQSYSLISCKAGANSFLAICCLGN